MVQKTDESHIHRKRVTKENDLTRKMVSRILMLHECGRTTKSPGAQYRRGALCVIKSGIYENGGIHATVVNKLPFL